MSLDPTNVVLAIGALGSAFTVPIISARRRRNDTTDVNLVNINNSISRERDRAQAALEKQAQEHSDEIEQMRRHHQQEINDLRDRWEIDAAEMRRGLDAEASDMKRRYDEQIATLSTRLAECQKTVNGLYRELYELQRLLPPDARPHLGP